MTDLHDIKTQKNERGKEEKKTLEISPKNKNYSHEKLELTVNKQRVYSINNHK